MNLHIHLVFATKYRRYVFTKQILDALKIIFPSVCNDFEADLVEFDGEKYHVHSLITCLVNSLKRVSSRLIQKKRNIPPFVVNYGQLLSGRPLISSQVVEAPLLLLSTSTLNSRIRLTEKILDPALISPS